MHQYGAETTSGTAGGIVGWWVSHWFAGLLAVHPYVVQGCVTLGFTLASIALGHLLKRFLVRRLPIYPTRAESLQARAERLTQKLRAQREGGESVPVESYPPGGEDEAPSGVRGGGRPD